MSDLKFYPKGDYDKDFGVGSYINATACLYRGIHFRKGIVLHMAEDTFIGDGCKILVPRLTMAKGSQINAGTIIAGKDEVTLEENVVISYGCILLTASDTPYGKHMNDASLETQRKIIHGPIILRSNCFIGARATIMPNVEIGQYTVIGANIHITHDILSYQVVIPKQQLQNIDRRTYWDKMQNGETQE